MYSTAKKIFHAILSFFPDLWAVHILYIIKFKRVLNIKQPQTFNEKLNWRKIYQRDVRFVAYADKISVKSEIEKHIDSSHVIPTLWYGETARDIPFDSLKSPFVIKTNHGCNDAVFVKDPSTVDIPAIVKHFERALNVDCGRERREWAYQHIPKKILVERMLLSEEGSVPNDYKLFVFHGVVKFVQVDKGRFNDHFMAFYDRDWNKLPFTKGAAFDPSCDARPDNLDLMISLAETIGKQFDFVRIDLYDTPNGVYFGEATFCPAGGFGKFHPSEWDGIFGQCWEVER